MSYDLVVWESPVPRDEEQALQIYDALLDGDDAAVSPSSRVESFRRELFAGLPPLDDADDEEVDEVVWAAETEGGPGHEVLAIVWSAVDEVVPRVQALAREHGLYVFDPGALEEGAAGASSPSEEGPGC